MPTLMQLAPPDSILPKIPKYEEADFNPVLTSPQRPALPILSGTVPPQNSGSYA